MSISTDNTTLPHGKPTPLGILLVNLGTPDSPGVADVRRYLAEFLSDHRVIEVPRPIWKIILHGFILRTRPKRSAKAYARIWTEQGSPLLWMSQRLAAALEESLQTQTPGPVKVVLAMRYGTPSVAAGLAELRNANAQRILILPLYPQYSATTTASIFDAVTQELRRWRWIPELRFVNHYHDAPGYIRGVAESIRQFQDTQGRPDRLLLSFHGIPKDYFLAGDPYYCECQKSARLIAEALGLTDDQYKISFQSRLGPRDWLKPYTDETLKDWARSGVKNVQVTCPGFAVDCLETLEEIAIENKEAFIEAGGESFHYIPALNECQAHIEALVEVALNHSQGWPELSAQLNSARSDGDLRSSRMRAEQAIANYPP